MIPLKDSNPTQRFPVVTVLLIAINVAVFLLEATLDEQRMKVVIDAYAFVPQRLLHPGDATPGPVPSAATVLTSLFLHGGLFHLSGNMLYLWIFGNNVEDAMGRLRFLAFYVLTGALATLGHAAFNTASTVPLIGASGAISGILGAYLLLYPGARVLTLFTLGFFVRMIEIPALAVLVFWFVLQLLSAFAFSGSVGGVAWYAHLGGFLAGMALIGAFKRKEVPLWGGRRHRSL